MIVRKQILTISLLVTGILGISYAIGALHQATYPANLHFVRQVVPDGFPKPVYTFSDNPLSLEGIELGRKLFYDGRLSVDGNYACVSCHNQLGAFGLLNHDRAHGYNHSHTLRNAPVLFNLAWQKEFHWDGQYNSLVSEAVQPITSPTEMAETFPGIIKKLQKDPTYPRLFKTVFNSSVITREMIVKALAQFTGSLVSADSRYDRMKQGKVVFTKQELSGYQLFEAHCAVCHTEPMFTDFTYRNIGLPLDTFLKDRGRMGVTHLAADSLKFKVPTLRNVAVSSNYMHDGRFNTIGQCLKHYSQGVQLSSTLDPLLVKGISLTKPQMTDLTEFLKTLTDSAFIKNPKLGQP